MIKASEFDPLNTIWQEEPLALLWYEKVFGIEIQHGKESIECQRFTVDRV